MKTHTVYRMSSIGHCPRALSAEKLGYEAAPAPGWLERAAEEGKWHEQRIKRELEQEAEEQVYDEQLEVFLRYPDFTLLGHIDGKILDKDKFPRLLEIKSMSQFEFDRWTKGGFKGFPEYADQLTCYMGATGLKEALYIVKNRSSGYEDRRIVTEQPSSFEDIIQKVMDIEFHIQAKSLVEAEFDPNSLKCRRCEYKTLCVPEPKELSPVEQMDLELAAERWREGSRLITQGEELVSFAKKIFEQHTKATGIDKWRWMELAIVLVHVKETLTYPKKKLLEVFTEEQLKPASEIKLPHEYVRIEDLRREE